MLEAANGYEAAMGIHEAPAKNVAEQRKRRRSIRDPCYECATGTAPDTRRAYRERGAGGRLNDQSLVGRLAKNLPA